MAVVYPFNELPTICRDADDNHILQVADYIKADYIISGDKDLLVLGGYEQTKIVSPRQFFDLYIEH